MKTIFKLLIFVFVLTGCNATGIVNFNVTVDSISTPSSKDFNRYVLLPDNQGLTVDDLQFQEYAGYVDRALASHGFTKAKDYEDANVAIFIGYGIGEPETRKRVISTPILGKTGVSSSSTYGTINTVGNTSTVSTETRYTPTYGVTGYNKHETSFTTFTRYLTIDALDLNEYRVSEKKKEVWKTTVTSTGSSGDLRRVLPVLVAASQPYISKNTGRKIAVSLREEDQSVLDIKGISTEN